jgi:hypothetical protein
MLSLLMRLLAEFAAPTACCRQAQVFPNVYGGRPVTPPWFFKIIFPIKQVACHMEIYFIFQKVSGGCDLRPGPAVRFFDKALRRWRRIRRKKTAAPAKMWFRGGRAEG